MDIQFLLKELGSIRAVAKQTGYSRNTVRKMLRSVEPPVFEKPVRRGGVDDFKEYLTKRFTDMGCRPLLVKLVLFTSMIALGAVNLLTLKPKLAHDPDRAASDGTGSSLLR